MYSPLQTLVTTDDILALFIIGELPTLWIKIRRVRKLSPLNDLPPLDFRVPSYLYHL